MRMDQLRNTSQVQGKNWERLTQARRQGKEAAHNAIKRNKERQKEVRQQPTGGTRF